MHALLQPGNAPPGLKASADADGEGAEGDYDAEGSDEPTVQGQLAPEVRAMAPVL